MKKICIILASLFAFLAFGSKAMAQDCTLTFEGIGQSPYYWNYGWVYVEVYQNGSLIGTFPDDDEFDVSTSDGPVSLVGYADYASDFNYVGLQVIDGNGNMLVNMFSLSGCIDGEVFDSLSPCPDCYPINLSVSDIGTSSATVSWDESGSASSWEYTYGTSSVCDNNWTTVSTTSVTLTGLTGATDYYFFVRSGCDEDIKKPVSINFHTGCETFTELPYTQDFEDQSSLYCWDYTDTVVDNTSSTTYEFPRRTNYISSPSVYGNDYYMLELRSRAGRVTARSPKFDVSDDVDVVFYAAGTGSIEVGYCTASDGSDITVVETLNLSGQSSLKRYVVDFSSVSVAGGFYVTFSVPKSLSTYGPVIDDVSIMKHSTCPIPYDFAIDESKTPVSGQVSLTWKDSVGTKWQVVYGPRGFDPDGDDVRTVAALSTSIDVTGLSNDTAYDFWLRGDCGGTYSFWPENPMVSSYPASYNLHKASDTITACDVNIFDDGGAFANYGYTNNTGAGNGMTEYTLVVRPTSNDESVRLQGYVQLYSWTETSDPYRSYLDIYEGEGTTGSLLAHYECGLNYSDLSVDIASEMGPVTLYFKIPTYSYTSTGFGLTASCYETPACKQVRNFAFNNSNGKDAMFSWECGSDPDKFVLTIYDTAGVEVTHQEVDGSMRADTIWDGLSEKSLFTATISSVCNNVPNAVVPKVEFRTPCIVGGDLEYEPDKPTTTTTSYFPCGSAYYSTSVYQVMVPEDKIEGTAFDGIKFTATSVSGSADSAHLKIYVDVTNETTHSSYIEPTDSIKNLYFDDDVAFVVGENVLQFDSAFTYPGSGSIVITFFRVSNGSYYVYTPAVYDYVVGQPAGWYSYNYSDPYSLDPWNMSYSYSNYYKSPYTLTSPCGDPSCAPVKFTRTEADSTNIYLAWNKGNEETAWNIEYKGADDTSWTVAAANHGEQEYTITGLKPGTEYTVRVVTVCDGTNTATRKTKLTTDCAHESRIALSFNEDFSMPSGGQIVPNCWTRTGYQSGLYTYNYNYYSTGYDDEWYLYSSLSYYYETKAALVSPAITNIKNKALTIYTKGYTSNYDYDYYVSTDVIIGVATDPTDPSTYTPLDSFNVAKFSDWTFHYALANDDVEGEYFYIQTKLNEEEAAASGYSYYYSYAYLDSLRIDVAPSCLWLKELSVADITNDGATVTISDAFDRGKYNVYYNTVDNFKTATKLSGSPFTTTSATLTGLSAQTEYFVWVEAVCSGNSTSPQMRTRFTTGCDPVVVTSEMPFESSFEDEDELDCFQFVVTGSGTANWKTVANSSYTYAYTDENAFCAKGQPEAEVMLVLPTFDFSGLDTTAAVYFYMLPFAHPSYGTTPNNTEVTIYYRTAVSGDWTEVTNFGTQQNNWGVYGTPLPKSQGASIYQVGISLSNMTNDSYNWTMIDDVTVGRARSCAPPTSFSISDVTDRSVTGHWTGVNVNTTALKVQYRTQNAWNWSSRIYEEGNEAVIAPLEMATTYDIRVASMCGAEVSDYSSPITFTTEFCTDNNVVTNYTSTQKADTINGQLFNCQYYTGTIYSYAEVLIPASQLTGLTDVNMLTIDAASDEYGTYMNGVTIFMANTTASDLTGGFLYDGTFTQVFKGDLNYNVAGPIKVMLPNAFSWDGSSNIVVGFFRQPSTYGYEYDNQDNSNKFKAHVASKDYFCYGGVNASFDPSDIEYLPYATSKTVPDVKLTGCNAHCYEPIVARTTSTANSITVEWYKEKNLNVNVQIKAADATAWDAVVNVPAGSTNYTFNMLPAMTKFDIRLQRDCSGDGSFVSDWVTISATTDTACSIPEAVKATEVGAKTATLSWTSGPVASKWEIHVWNTGFDKYYTVSSNPATIDGLTPGNSYKVQVRAFCGKNDHVVGEWSETATFQNTCDPVTALVANISGTEAKLSWTGASTNKKYMVAWGPKDFNPNEQIGYAEVEGTSYTISGLKGQTYTFRVRGICGDGWNSVWTSTNAAVVGIDDVDGQNAQFNLQPNPATDRVTLSLDAFEGTANVSILSVDGRQVSQFTTAESISTIDLSEFAAGTYFVRVQTEGWTSVRKLIVK